MRTKNVSRLVCLGLGAAALTATAARAEISLVDKDGLKLGVNLNATAGYVNTNHTNFGDGVWLAPDYAKNGGDNADWFEGYLKAGLTGSVALPGAGSVYGEWQLVGSATRSGPDAEGWNVDNPSEIEQELAYVGWKSGKLLPLGEDFLDLSFGQRDFKIGDGFLFWDGNSAGHDEGAFWLGPKTSFTRAAVARLNGKPVRGDVFWLRSDPDSGNTELYGVNAEWDTGVAGTLGALYARVTDTKDGFEARDGLRVYDLRWNATLVDRLFLSAEYAWERKSKSDTSLDAYAWYAEAGYTMKGLPWEPSISYRYSFFSGDDLGSRDNEGFDPLFYGFGRGWGTWLQGEIVGEYLLFNSNEKAQMVALRAKPAESLGIGLMYFRIDLDEDNYFGAPTDGTRFADEWNLYADWQALDNLYVGAVAGLAKPGDAAESYFGDDQNYTLFEVTACLTY